MDNHALWACRIPGIRSRSLLRAGRILGENPAEFLYGAGERDLSRLAEKVWGKNAERAVRAVLTFRRNSPEQMAEDLRRSGICFVSIYEKDYPSRLARIYDPPYGIYYRGRLPSEGPCAAVIGARRCSEYGRDMARYFAGALASCGVCIISGMALGIDGIAGRAALERGGESIAVLGCGCDICYPCQNGDLYEDLAGRGCVLSEYAPGTGPRAEFFPARNRIIAGLSDCVLVIEAGDRSGTMITVERALEEGREVFCVPGRVTDPLSAGCNRLIREGAGAACSPEDLLLWFSERSARGISVRTE